MKKSRLWPPLNSVKFAGPAALNRLTQALLDTIHIVPIPVRDAYFIDVNENRLLWRVA